MKGGDNYSKQSADLRTQPTESSIYIIDKQGSISLYAYELKNIMDDKGAIYLAKDQIKINKKHDGKEFSNTFRFIGKVNPVRTKDNETDSWIDVPFFQTTKTRTDKDRRVLQFNVETATRNELKVELAGMEKPEVYVYSRTNKNSRPVKWADRFDKTAYPDETYHLIDQEWDKSKDIGEWIESDMWVDVRGSYEFNSFVNDDGETINMVKRVIQNVFPLKNGEVVVTGVKEGDAFAAYNQAEGGYQLGYAKADKDGVATIRVGWLNPEGGKLYVCKVEDGKEGKRLEQSYSDGVTENGKITIKNNLDSVITVHNAGKKDQVTYIRDFNDENFVEINTFEMQVGIKSTYQDEATKDTKINGVFLSYGKERSTPNDVEMMVYYSEPEEGKTAFADAFARLNRLDFLKVKGIDNNRATFGMVEVRDTDNDNPFEDVGERESNFERINTGTKKGLEVISYLTGTYQRELLTEEEITSAEEGKQGVAEDPFTSVGIDDSDLPF